MIRTQSNVDRRSLYWLLLLVLATVVLYLPGVHIWYYGDDFQYLYRDPAQKILYFFHHRNLFHGFYRPVNSSIIAITQTLAGWETWPIHLVSMVVHGVLAWMVYAFMKRERFTTVQAMMASAFMVISQENASGVLSVDTFSQVSGTFFGCVTLWLLYRGSRNGPPDNDPTRPVLATTDYLLALVSFAFCLASKETSVGYLPIVGLLLLALNRGPSAFSKRFVRAVVQGLPFLAMTVFYMWFRASIGLSQPSGGGGTYGFSVGLNVVRNAAQFLFAAILPASSADAFVAVTNREMLPLALMVGGSLVFLAVVVYGLWKGGRHRSYLLLGVFAIAGLFPAMLMNHVGELYLYNSMPFISVFVGAGLGTLVARSAGRRGMSILFGAFLLGLVISHTVAIHRKAQEMVANGRSARRLLGELMPYVKQMPPNGRLLLLNPPNTRPEYSVFLLNDFGVFRWGEHVLGQEAGRPDVDAAVVEQAELGSPRFANASLVLTLRNDSLVVYQRAGSAHP